ncbi:MAG: anhydro-N-acetylmuramic acid kinase, partial [Micrococcales bacterium]|nr:anhydro-N-acetylmuramic acid kinase [Micrococcales bacterium]
GQTLAQAALAGAASVPGQPIDLVASHGQTLYHWVEDGLTLGTLQVGQPAWIAEAIGCPVVSDFRSADVAAGGQGAPLAGKLDELWLGALPGVSVALNIGGLANITVVSDGRVTVWDTGPGNCLIDLAAQQASGEACDRDGALAASGHVDEAALAVLLADPYYKKPPPKSTGREYFDINYLDRLVPDLAQGAAMVATVTELTARTIADAIPSSARVVVSGGGVHNPVLMSRLRALIAAPVMTSAGLGLPVDAKEACLFALLGFLSVHGLSGTMYGPDGCVATGALHEAVLGSLTPPTGFHLDCVAPVRTLQIVGGIGD